jgi:putative phosphoribosyl transferase
MASRLALFMDRREAGRRLAEALERFGPEEPLVVALPRGGVPVGFEVARTLVAPLDILPVRKLGAPFNPEYGIGAIAEGGVRFIRRAEAELIGVSDEDLDEVVTRESAELERRQQLYRGGEEPLPVGRTVLLVDDGIATGGTAIAARQALIAAARRAVTKPLQAATFAARGFWRPA